MTQYLERDPLWRKGLINASGSVIPSFMLLIAHPFQAALWSVL
jgi:hypothetical protein